MITQKSENKEKETYKSSHELLEKGIDQGELFSDLRNQNKENIQLQQKANKSKITKKITQLQNLANPTNTENPSAEANKEQTNYVLYFCFYVILMCKNELLLFYNAIYLNIYNHYLLSLIYLQLYKSY